MKKLSVLLVLALLLNSCNVMFPKKHYAEEPDVPKYHKVKTK